MEVMRMAHIFRVFGTVSKNRRKTVLDRCWQGACSKRNEFAERVPFLGNFSFERKDND